MLGVVIPELDTPRLHLRAFEPGDLDAYAEMYADPEVMRYLEDGRPLDRAAAWRSMAVNLGHWHLRGYGQWALVKRGSGELIGRAGLWQPEGWPEVEVGWLLGRAHWGQGFATEAGRAAIEYAFDVLGVGRLTSMIQPQNRPSRLVAERLGERYERTTKLGGATVEVYAVDRTGWPLR